MAEADSVPPGHPVVRQLDAICRRDYRRLVAPLIRVVGSFEAAEDALQDAFARALSAWPRDGIPDEPVAWLHRVARNRALDLRRRRGVRDDKADMVAREMARDEAYEPSDSVVRDDSLRLIFTCCHPSLASESRIALTLHTVCGLSSDEVARAFLVKRETMQQRLLRAKRKIDGAGIPYVIPEREDLPPRLDSVLRTVYLVFNEGYDSTSGDELIRGELCQEAIRLGRFLVEMLPTSSGTSGLLALMLLHHSRRNARTNPTGDLVTLEDQDRSLWDDALIQEALPMVEAALKCRPVSSFAVEASIAALHARAARASETDWRQIAALYEVLAGMSGGNPVVLLNGAVAIAMAGNIEDGLGRLKRLGADLPHYHLLHSARAELLIRAGRLRDAAVALREALVHASNEVERRFLERRLAWAEAHFRA
jgi:RNA polymerase sigma-70 factor (ECF subfamily)